MRVAITGSSGLLGRSLATSLRTDGHEVIPVVRTTPQPDAIAWDPAAGRIDPSDLAGFEAVVHYASEPVDRRWTARRKRLIHESRANSTRVLAEAIASLDDPPALLSGSATGWYGDRGDETLTEDSGAGDDFMAMVCRDWESATRVASDAGVRVCNLRNGVVIAEEGPLISKVKLPFSLGLGGRVGSGRQYVPWIALDDQVAAVRFLVQHPDLSGPFNLVAPATTTNAQLTAALGLVMRRPTVLPIPLFALRAAYGEGGRALAAVSQKVVPQRLLDAGFHFIHDDIESALRVALST
jgi:hypothetical protein